MRSSIHTCTPRACFVKPFRYQVHKTNQNTLLSLLKGCCCFLFHTKKKNKTSSNPKQHVPWNQKYVWFFSSFSSFPLSPPNPNPNPNAPLQRSTAPPERLHSEASWTVTASTDFSEGNAPRRAALGKERCGLGVFEVFFLCVFGFCGRKNKCFMILCCFVFNVFAKKIRVCFWFSLFLVTSRLEKNVFL